MILQPDYKAYKWRSLQMTSGPTVWITLSFPSLLSWIPGHHKAEMGFSVPCLNCHPTEFMNVLRQMSNTTGVWGHSKILTWGGTSTEEATWTSVRWLKIEVWITSSMDRMHFNYFLPCRDDVFNLKLCVLCIQRLCHNKTNQLQPTWSESNDVQEVTWPINYKRTTKGPLAKKFSVAFPF